MPRVIFHVDMDAFYASVEQRDHPEYRGKPVIVGSPPDQRGVVCAASYEARKFRVRSAMPSRTAARLCPAGIFVRPRMDAYRAESKLIMAILESFTPAVEKVSVDEAYLDMSESFKTVPEQDDALTTALPVAAEIKRRIAEERKLTASIGDLQATAIDLHELVGSFAMKLRERAFGNDDRPVDLSDERKSISAENTFLNDTDDRPTLRAALKELASDVADTLSQHELGALTVQVKVRYSDFTTLTRQVRVEEPVTTSNEIYRLACFLLARDELVKSPLRLIGIGLSTLVPPTRHQLLLPI